MDIQNPSQQISYRGTIFAMVLCGGWVAAVGLMGTLGFFETPRNEPHTKMLAAVLAPTMLFMTAFCLIRSVRSWTLQLNPAMLVLPHAWRTLGFTFLVLWAYGILPPNFAAPAGFGDFTIGMAAPFVAVALWLHWSLARRFAIVFHVLGLLDLTVAQLTATLGFGVSQAEMGNIDPLTAFPMVLVPTVAVPLLIMGHIIGILNLFFTNRRG